MVNPVVIYLQPEKHLLYPPPKDFEWIWANGYVHAHQYAALVTHSLKCRIHAPTATGKSRAAAFYAVAPFHRNEEELIQATFAYPTNLLTRHQFEEGLIEGLIDNLGYRSLGSWSIWPPDSNIDEGILFRRLAIPGGGELRVAKLTGADLANCLNTHEPDKGKADLLEDFLEWLNAGHNFLVASPDVLAYAAHECYGSKSLTYYRTRKLRIHSMLRNRTLVLDEYHQYDPFTLINLERLIGNEALAPRRLLLLSATKRAEYFPDVPSLEPPSLPSPEEKPRIASRQIKVEFHFSEMCQPETRNDGLALYIYNSVVENRRQSARLRHLGIPIVQWDGTRKDEPNDIGTRIHLVLGTSAIEVGLNLPADEVITEWCPAWMTPEQITQRIGRVGRMPGNLPAIARIYVPGASSYLQEKLSEINGQIITKDELHERLVQISDKAPLRREQFVSYYYFNENRLHELYDKQLLEPFEKLRYSFRPPGSQALFIDRSESQPHLFLYDKAPILNRYDCKPPTPEDISLVQDGWKRVCNTLGLDIEQDIYVIHGERDRRERDWLPLITGRLEDLRKNTLRRFYIERQEQLDRGSIFI